MRTIPLEVAAAQPRPEVVTTPPPATARPQLLIEAGDDLSNSELSDPLILELPEGAQAAPGLRAPFTGFPRDSIAHVLCGGNAPQDKYIGGNAISDYAQMGIVVGQNCKAYGVTAVWLQNPGGVYQEFWAQGQTDMRCNQWIIAEERGAPYANRDRLEVCFTNLALFGVKRVYCYIGSPTQLADPVAELPKCVAPYIEAAIDSKGRQIVELWIGLDAIYYHIEGGKAEVRMAEWEPNDPLPRAIAAVPVPVFGEARLDKAQLTAGLGYLVKGTAATAAWDRNFVPDMTYQPGIHIRTTDYTIEWTNWPEIKTWPPNIIPLLRNAYNWHGATPPPNK